MRDFYEGFELFKKDFISEATGAAAAFYCEYLNERGVSYVNMMRPLTEREKRVIGLEGEVKRFDLLEEKLKGLAEDFYSSVVEKVERMPIGVELELEGSDIDAIIKSLWIDIRCGKSMAEALNNLRKKLQKSASGFIDKVAQIAGQKAVNMILSGYTNAAYLQAICIEETCTTCIKAAERVISLEDAQFGDNLPPEHPNCDCGILILDESRNEIGRLENLGKRVQDTIMGDNPRGSLYLNSVKLTDARLIEGQAFGNIFEAAKALGFSYKRNIGGKVELQNGSTIIHFDTYQKKPGDTLQYEIIRNGKTLYSDIMQWESYNGEGKLVINLDNIAAIFDTSISQYKNHVTLHNPLKKELLIEQLRENFQSGNTFDKISAIFQTIGLSWDDRYKEAKSYYQKTLYEAQGIDPEISAAAFDMSVGNIAAEVVVGTAAMGLKAVKIASDGVGQGLAQVGDDFGKMGKMVEHPGQKVNWDSITNHGTKRMAQRGVTQSMVDDWVANGKALKQSSGNHLYISKEGAAVLNSSGELVTTYTKANFDVNMLNIIKQLFGE